MPKEVCNTCGLPDELCVCDDLSESEKTLEVYTEERKFNDVTIIEGFNDDSDLDSLSSTLKKEFACGGTYKESEENLIELQGDHQNDVKDWLDEEGYPV